MLEVVHKHNVQKKVEAEEATKKKKEHHHQHHPQIHLN